MKILSSNYSCQRRSNQNFSYSQASKKAQKRECLRHAHFTGGLAQKKVDFVAPDLSLKPDSMNDSSFSTFSLHNIILLAGVALFGAFLFSRSDLKPVSSQPQNGQSPNITGIFNRSFNGVEPLKMCNLSEAPLIRQERRITEVPQILQPPKSVVEESVVWVRTEEPSVVSVEKEVMDQKPVNSLESKKQVENSGKKKIKTSSKESSSLKMGKKECKAFKQNFKNVKLSKDQKKLLKNQLKNCKKS